MFASSLLPRLLPRWPPRRPRAAALRGLACGLVLAAGLSTLAGREGAVDPSQHGSQPLRRAPQAADEAGAEMTAAQPAAPIIVSVVGTGAGVAKALIKAAGGPREPPPYAPGGDDVLSVGETPPLLPALGRPEPAATIDGSLGAPGSAAGGGSFWQAPGQASAARPALRLAVGRSGRHPGKPARRARHCNPAAPPI